MTSSWLGRRQAIIWTKPWRLSIGPLGTNSTEIVIDSYTLSFKKMHLKMSSGNWQSFSLGLNVLISKSVMCLIAKNGDFVIKWKHFPSNWTFVRVIHRSPGGGGGGGVSLRLMTSQFKDIVTHTRKIEESKMHILQCMGSKFCVKFQRCPLKFHAEFWTHTLQNMNFTRC